MPPLQLWLFEEPPVTLAEVEAWVKVNAGLSPENWRFSNYVQQWNVPDKIARIKQERRAANEDGKPSPKRRRSDWEAM